MNFFDSIRSWFIWVTNLLVSAALDAYGSWLPLDWLGDILGDLSTFTARVSGYLWTASNWYEDTIAALREILSWGTIKAFIRSWLFGIEATIAWFWDWWVKVGLRIDSWWDGVKSTVRDWIALATEGLAGLLVAWDNFWHITFPTWTSRLEVIGADLANFFTVTLPTLFDIKFAEEWWVGKFLDVTEAINTAFTDRESWWSGWQDIKDTVLNFFTDPLGWLEARFTDWFLGPEE